MTLLPAGAKAPREVETVGLHIAGGCLERGVVVGWGKEKELPPVAEEPVVVEEKPAAVEDESSYVYSTGSGSEPVQDVPAAVEQDVPAAVEQSGSVGGWPDAWQEPTQVLPGIDGAAGARTRTKKRRHRLVVTMTNELHQEFVFMVDGDEAHEAVHEANEVALAESDEAFASRSVPRRGQKQSASAGSSARGATRTELRAKTALALEGAVASTVGCGGLRAETARGKPESSVRGGSRNSGARAADPAGSPRRKSPGRVTSDRPQDSGRSSQSHPETAGSTRRLGRSVACLGEADPNHASLREIDLLLDVTVSLDVGRRG
jgi:hypothetical protein